MTTQTWLSLWPVAFISILMVVGAVIDGWKLKVPNWLTFPMILTGWSYWATQGLEPFGWSVAGAFVAGGLLIVPYAIGGMGAGDVKMYAGFGAWMVPLSWFGVENLLLAFAVSVVLGAVMAAAMIWRAGTLAANLANAQDIVNDWKTAGSVGAVAERAKRRKPTLQLLPYGIPLTIGSLALVAWLLFFQPGIAQLGQTAVASL